MSDEAREGRDRTKWCDINRRMGALVTEVHLNNEQTKEKLARCGKKETAAAYSGCNPE